MTSKAFTTVGFATSPVCYNWQGEGPINYCLRNNYRVGKVTTQLVTPLGNAIIDNLPRTQSY